jgi:5-methylcytosine-specific restriction endonuclease McrA
MTTNTVSDVEEASGGQPGDSFWLVAMRAKGKCEYCDLDGSKDMRILACFHRDHIVPQKSDGKWDQSNLALCCVSCNLTKSSWNPADGTDGTLTRVQLIERVREHLGPRTWPYYTALLEALRDSGG